MADLIIDDYFKKGLFIEHQIVTANKLNMNYEKSTKLINNFVEALNSTYYKEFLDFDISMTKTDSAIAEMFSTTLKSILKRTLSSGAYGEFGFSDNDPYLKNYHSASDIRDTIKKVGFKTSGNDCNLVISGSSLKLDANLDRKIENQVHSKNLNLIADDIFLTIEAEDYSVKDTFLNKISYQNYYDYEDEEEQYVEVWTSVLNNRNNGINEGGTTGQQELRLDSFNIISSSTDDATVNTLSLTKNDSLILRHGYILNYDTEHQEEHIEEIDLFHKLDFLTSANYIVKNIEKTTEPTHQYTQFKVVTARFEDSSDKTSNIITSDWVFDISFLGGVHKKYTEGDSRTEINMYDGFSYIELYNKYVYNSNTYHSALKVQGNASGDKNSLTFEIPFKGYSSKTFGVIGYFYEFIFRNSDILWFKDVYSGYTGEVSKYKTFGIGLQLYYHETFALDISIANFFDRIPNDTYIKASGTVERELSSNELSKLNTLKNEGRIEFDSDEVGDRNVLFIYAIKKVAYNQIEIFYTRRHLYNGQERPYGTNDSQYYLNSYTSSFTLTYSQLGTLIKNYNTFRN